MTVLAHCIARAIIVVCMVLVIYYFSHLNNKIGYGYIYCFIQLFVFLDLITVPLSLPSSFSLQSLCC